MSVMRNLSRLAAGWRRRRAHRRTAAIVAALPDELQRDIGWPSMELYKAARTRSLPR